ncbi:hypothetical protein R1sor_009358 [Riccia sorocarpa]|uniref:Pre-mRNA-splicing factor Syf1-like N-terminal HAT-repeats domain-containing protein n=1 Tax=Riccia sorocarpa TaxID=122646 RepID=A0ABD3HUV1_9MARC
MAMEEADSAGRFLTKKETQVRLPRSTRVQNKTPATVQITAEQILREARVQQEAEIRAHKEKFTDAEELSEYRLLKRKGFEDHIRAVTSNISVWVKYAQWEEPKGFCSCKVHMGKSVEGGLPEHDVMAEVFRNGNEKSIFERWMTWEPDHHAWSAYMEFELKYNETDRARAIFERYVQCHSTVKAWVRFAKFEVRNGEVARARRCYERAIEKLGEDGQFEELFIAFAQFEEKCKELERASYIYRYALDHVPKGHGEELFSKFVSYEKQYGNREGIEDAIVGERRFQYEEDVKKNPLNYDTWFDYLRLEESSGNRQRTREVYRRAISNMPPVEEKRYWQRYIYLWINYALYEELEAKDMERTREVYRDCLKLIPHKKFAFAKLWLLAAQFEIRQKHLSGARSLLGTAIGMAPKDKIFQSYIEIELQLGNLDGCRNLYEKYLEWTPANCYAWTKYADLENGLGETERGRAIFELAIAQPVLDMPELLWKAYIDFGISRKEHERTRQLYERMLNHTKHLKVWVSYAKFEAGLPLEEESRAEEEGREPDPQVVEEQQKQRALRARGVFERAFENIRSSTPELKEEGAMLLEEWQETERNIGDLANVAFVQEKMPRRVTRKRPVISNDGTPAGFEEYTDYFFPEETGIAPNLKILEAAYRWKKQKVTKDGEE